MPPATATSPEQQRVLDLLNLRPASEQPNPFDLPSITVGLMQALTNVKSERAAKDASEKVAQTPSPETTVRTRVDPATGHTVHDITHKNIVPGNAQETVQGAYDAPQADLQKQLEPFMTGVNAPLSKDELVKKLDSFGGRYRLSRELGNNPMMALVDAGIITTAGGSYAKNDMGEAANRHREEAVLARQKEALPFIQEQDRQMRLAQADKKLDRQLGKENASIVASMPFFSWEPGQDLERGAAAIGKKPEDLTEREKNGIANAATVSRTAYEKTRSTKANDIIKSLKIEDAAGLDTPETMQKYIESTASTVPGGMKTEETNRLAARVSGLRREWNNLDRQKQQQIQAEVTRNRILKQQADFAEQMAQLNTPEAAKEAAAASMKDGNQFHMLPDKSPVERAFKAQVASLIKAETGGRLPQEIKVGSPEAQRLETVYQGRADVKWMRDTATGWATKGVDMSGVFRGRVLNAVTEGKPSSVIARAATKEIPGFSNLSPADQQAFIEQAATFYHRSLSLTAREVKSNMSGRPGERIFDFFKAATPSLAKDPTVLQGLFSGAEQEFNNAEAAVRHTQWGGEPPGSKPQTTDRPPIVQQNKRTGEYRFSTDGGKTWQSGKP